MNVAVIGLGKLGLPLAVLQAERHCVFGVDSNPEAVASINSGLAPIREPGVDTRLSKALKDKTFSAHADYSVVANCEISLVIVPTPSLADGSFTSKYVVEAVEEIGKQIRGFPGLATRHVVVICSTVMPGECDTAIRDALEQSAEEPLGDRLQLIYSPEFIALGSVIADMKEPAMTMIGCQQEWAAELYRDNILPPGARDGHLYYMNWISAEIAKISLNAYVTMKISFANALSELCEQYPGADAFAITDAIGEDPRIGHRYISPGGPYGGPCFPRDNRAFAQVGKNVGVDMWIPRQVDRVNEHQIERMVRKVLSYGRQSVAIAGLSYKLGAPVVEEAFGYKLAETFAADTDLRVRVYDRIVPKNADLFPDGVDWFDEPMGCVANDTVTVLTLPDPEIIERLPGCFETPSRARAIVLDPWGCIPWGPWHDSHIVRLGLGD